MLTLRAITPLQCITYILSRKCLRRTSIVYVGLIFFSEFLGGFIAAAIVFGIYYEAINQFDGGHRQVRKNFSLGWQT